MKFGLQSRLLIAGLVIAAGVFAYRILAESQRKAVLLAELRAEERQREGLEKIVTLQFSGHVTLADWMAEFTRQTGMPVEIVDQRRQAQWWDDAGPSAGTTLYVDFTPELPIELNLPPLSAREALAIFCRLLGIQWRLNGAGVIGLNCEETDASRELRIHPLPAELRFSPIDDLVEKLTNAWQMDRWADVGGPWELETTQDSISTLMLPAEHDQFETLLRQLATACRVANEVFPSSPPADSACEPIWLQGEAVQFSSWQRAFHKPITLHGADWQWQQLVNGLAKQAEFPIVVAPQAAHRLNLRAQRYTFQFEQVPLQQVLHELPIFNEFCLVLAPGGRALVLGPSDLAEDPTWQLLLAYPIGDLVAVGDSTREEDELIRLITTVIQSDSWVDVGGPATINILNRGRVLLISQSFEQHDRIKDLLTSIRTVRSGAERQVVLPPTLNPQIDPMLRQRLQTNVSLLNVGHPRVYAIQNLLADGKITLATNYGNQDGAGTHVWCYLPPRSLQSNLELFFRSCDLHRAYLDYVALPGEPHFSPEIQAHAVFDLRPWLAKRRDQPDLVDLLSSSIEPNSWEDVGGPGGLVTYRNLLIVRSEPEVMSQVRDFLAALAEHVQASPKRWRGKLLAGDALNQPLDMDFPSAEALQRGEELNRENQAIETKLLRRITKSIPEMTLGEAILELAREQEVPLIIQQPVFKPAGTVAWTGGTGAGTTIVKRHPIPPRLVDLKAPIGPLEVQDQPLGELLQTLVGDQGEFRWQVRDGYLTIAGSPHISGPLDWFVRDYSVDDLLVPRGKLLPRQLVRTLETAIQENDLEDEVGGTSVDLHFGNILSKSFTDPEPRAQELFEQLLRDLRSGKLRPAPAEKGDREYLYPPFRPFWSSPIPVVG